MTEICERFETAVKEGDAKGFAVDKQHFIELVHHYLPNMAMQRGTFISRPELDELLFMVMESCFMSQGIIQFYF